MSPQPKPGERPSFTLRLAAWCRVHCALAALSAIIVLATGGYLMSPPRAESAFADARNRLTKVAQTTAEPSATMVWRDKTGAVYRVKIDGARSRQFRRDRDEILVAARAESHAEASVAIHAALMPILADVTARIPQYADWYYDYTTKYLLMARALVPAGLYLGRSLDPLSSGNDSSIVQAISSHMLGYLEDQYVERVIRPRETQARLEAVFEGSFGALREHWGRLAAEQRDALQAFIEKEGRSAERVPVDLTKGLSLDWDGQSQARHLDVTYQERFRRGLVTVRLEIPRSAKLPAETDSSPEAGEGSDEITSIIINLFDKVVGPAVSEMGALFTAILAGGAASGSTVGMAAAGMPGIIATGATTAVPVGAVIGLLTTIVAEMISNKLEESLTRTEFERKLTQTAEATEKSIEARMIEVLDQHVEAAITDIVNPVAVK